MSTDPQAVYIDASINCSSKTITKLIKREDVCYVLHVECSNTLFRRAYEFHTSTYRAAIPADNLNDAVEVNVFALAKKDLAGYKVEMAHEDYGDAAFDVEKGGILAIGEGQVFYVESDFDSLSRIGSIMQIQEAREEGDQPMRADYNGDKILIILSKKDFADYKLLKGTDAIAVPLTTAIVLPVLLEAIHIAKEETEADDARRWLRALRRRLDSMNLSLDRDPLELTQQLLELPLKRTFASARMLAEGAS